MTTTWIIVDEPGVAGLLDTARNLGRPTAAVVVGPHELAASTATAGVDRCLWLGETGDAPVEAFATAVAAVVADGAPGVVLAAARPSARALVGAVAATLRAPAMVGAVGVETDGDTVLVEREVLGGIARRTERCDGPVCLVVDGGGVPEPGAAVPVEEVTAEALAVRVVENRPSSAPQVDLAGARRVVAVGRGLKAKEDLALVDRLAEAMGAAVACSRPVAEGSGFLPKDRYVGVSGRTLTPDVYLALGISGQVQHTVGIRGAGTIVAVNTDADAPFMKECDYAVVGDLYTFVPALAAALQS
ncbi:electron transfer flavoprotein subunit alpha/FixB family protein [Actinotalea sp. M2MS4P-6]|uniref:electron transfer flavoprotein subunit alpha/FixB family protein n=1 Tax=Actinotalea sp. M2MS4P-6 TaxID=2983762 RepID=UPI0021E405FC|nr:electron transfer flavoprotein subunit alpha/FixB family protein [Actinotalea sp. M2MS4P-6]MCV2394276.1 electron transfer flavoprotein subunit alpha/FixB family protein [Actinotalea sp. M2MS4P-6]